jgi:hypothetical protein
MDPTLEAPYDKQRRHFLYPPGSTFKMVVGLGALSEKVVGIKETIKDLGVYTRFSNVNAPPAGNGNGKPYHLCHGDRDIVGRCAIPAIIIFMKPACAWE